MAALKDFQKHLLINPNSNDGYYNLGVVLTDLDRKEEAILAYDKALDINPNDTDALMNRDLLLEADKG